MLQLVGRRNIVHRANVHLVRATVYESLLELVRRFEAQVPAVNVAGERERELALVKVLRQHVLVLEGLQLLRVVLLHLVVAEPLEEELVREHLLVEDLEPIRVEGQLAERALFLRGLRDLVDFHVENCENI